MSGKRIIVGQSVWGIADADAETVAGQVKEAMLNGTVVALELADSLGRAVTVYLNGKVAETVVVDLDGGPRPSEMI